MLKASGFIEAVGLSNAIIASDIMLKSANIELVGVELTKGMGYAVVKVQGEIGAVKAAVDAAWNARVLDSKLVSKTIIARPSNDLEKFIFSNDTRGNEKKIESNNIEEATSKSFTVELERDFNDSDNSELNFSNKIYESQESKESVSLNDNEYLDLRDYEYELNNNLSNDNSDNINEFENQNTEEIEINEFDNQNDSELKNEEINELNIQENSEELVYTCNLCKDPKCSRKKGNPHVYCIHYQN